MSILSNLFGKKQYAAPSINTTSQQQPSGKAGDLQKKAEIKQVLEMARERHQLPELKKILDILVAVEQLTNYATVVDIALEIAAEHRGVYIGELKSAYMKFWWQWHNHRDEPKYRAEKIIVIAGEAAQVYPDSEIGWILISCLLVWINQGGPDRSDILKEHFGNIPTLDEIRKYQETGK